MGFRSFEETFPNFFPNEISFIFVENLEILEFHRISFELLLHNTEKAFLRWGREKKNHA